MTLFSSLVIQLCAPTVVTEFIKVTTDMLPSCTQVLERNKRIVLPTRSAFGNVNQLDSFFPFDPYLLRHSSKHIASIYQTWSPAPAATTSASSVPTQSPTSSASSPSATARSAGTEAYVPSTHVSLTFLSSIPPGSYSDMPSSPLQGISRLRSESGNGEELLGSHSLVGSPSVLSMTPESVSNDVDFSWKYSWGGK